MKQINISRLSIMSKRVTVKLEIDGEVVTEKEISAAQAAVLLADLKKVPVQDRFNETLKAVGE